MDSVLPGMNADELYKLILSKYPNIGEKIVCDLHKPCHKQRQCPDKVTTRLIDFDEVKTEFSKVEKIAASASVDGVTYKGQIFCFVELKGWKEFLKHNQPPTDAGITEQSGKYNLKDKYECSRSICERLSGNNDLFASIENVFILVTDIDISENPLLQFQSNINALAQTSTIWEYKCNNALKSELNKQIKTIKKYYTNCRCLDQTLAQIS